MPATTALLLGLAAALGTPLAPAAPAKLDPGPFKPFDLTYLTRPGPCIVALRPAELCKQLGDGQKAHAEYARRTLGAVFAYLDGDLRAAAPPALADVSELVLTARVTLGIETGKDGTSAFGFDSVCAGTVRTAAPFDWDGRVKKWFAAAEVVKRAGRSYYRVPAAEADGPSPLCLFVADGRTLAFDTDEDHVKGLLDRLADGGAAPAPPGWVAVSRDAVAIAHRPASDDWLTAPDSPRRDLDMAIATLARRSAAVAVGFTPGDRTALRVVVTAANPKHAVKVRDALKAFIGEMRADDEVDPATAKLLAALAVTRDGNTVTAQGAVPGNLFRRLLGIDVEQ